MQRTPFGRRCILYVRRLNMSSLVDPLVGKFLHALEKKDYSWLLRFGDVTIRTEPCYSRAVKSFTVSGANHAMELTGSARHGLCLRPADLPPPPFRAV